MKNTTTVGCNVRKSNKQNPEEVRPQIRGVESQKSRVSESLPSLLITTDTVTFSSIFSPLDMISVSDSSLAAVCEPRLMHFSKCCSVVLYRGIPLSLFKSRRIPSERSHFERLTSLRRAVLYSPLYNFKTQFTSL